MARKIEAQLGFDPDEAPEQLLDGILRLTKPAGFSAASEVALSCAGAEPGDNLRRVLEFSMLPGFSGRIQIPAMNAAEVSTMPPWERGWRLAQKIRDIRGLGVNPVSDAALSELLEIPAKAFGGQEPASRREPLGLAIRKEAQAKTRFLFRKRNRTGLRFEASRFLADHLCTPTTENWLVAADNKTARQKVQRAFAAEFLAPIDSLREYLSEDFSQEAIEQASGYFGVSELVVSSHLANHGLIELR